MRSVSGTLAILAGLSLLGCSGSDSDPIGGSGGAIGTTGGSGTTGGNVGTGGNSSGTGGTSTNGGSNTMGGSGMGGAPANGGSTPGAGGSSVGGTSGGSNSLGGNAAGGSSNGGSSNGGKANSGGSSSGGSSNGGKSNSGGNSSGGAANGGKANSGGSSSGGASSGGASSGGKSGSGGAMSTCTEADKALTSNATGKHCGYTYEYWKDQGTGTLTLKPDGFNVNWSNINNLLGRKGIRPGSTSQIVTYSATYNPNGNSYLCVYGWTKGPLVEYYIVDSWGDWRPPGATSMGTVSSDGGTYDIYRTQRVNQPSIEGTQTFYQYWSVRTQKRTSGTITVGNHFTAWAGKGMNMGSLYEVSMTVEGYQSSGTASVSMSMR